MMLALGSLERSTLLRGDGFREDVLRLGTVVGNQVCLSDEIFEAIKQSHPRRIRGAGDVVAAVAQPVARMVDRVTGGDLEHCESCKQRRTEWNERLPFSQG
jgi:hypothetical protein